MINKTKFIAEISSNHNNDLNRIEKIIKACKKTGFYAVKFQLFKLDNLFHNTVLNKSKSHSKRKNWELNERYLYKINKLCKKYKIKLGCTPFDLKSYEIVRPYCDFIKISSYDTLRTSFIETILQEKKLTIISTGMMSNYELYNLNKIIKKNRKDNKIAILHCVSRYPTDPIKTNLSQINNLRNIFKTKVGWSDHTQNQVVIYEAATKFKADFIELHVDLDDRKGNEGDFAHCWTFQDLDALINLIKFQDKFLNSTKIKDISYEKTERKWRADPSDGLRPIKKFRKQLIKNL